jgi:hypothetical protein
MKYTAKQGSEAALYKTTNAPVEMARCLVLFLDVFDVLLSSHRLVLEAQLLNCLFKPSSRRPLNTQWHDTWPPRH